MIDRSKGVLRAFSCLGATLALLSCVGCAETGLECQDGDFYLNGEEFTNCQQCDDEASCYFQEHVNYSYDAFGRQSVSRRSVTAHCAGQSATMVNGVCQ